MLLNYIGKKTEKEILRHGEKAVLRRLSGPESADNLLVWGENLAVMKSLASDFSLRGKVDLVYTDPPFSTNCEFKIGDDRVATVSMSNSDKTAYHDKISGAEFIEFLRERFVHLKELMSEHGSIYVHIDYKIGHYVKVAMDEIFGARNFRNDISRIKCNPKNFRRKAYGNIKDMILFYSLSGHSTWNDPTEPFTQQDTVSLFKKTDEFGRKYTTVPLHAPGETENGKTGMKWRGMSPPKGRHWRSAPENLDRLDEMGLIEWSPNGVPRKKIYADEKRGKKMQDIWKFKDSMRPLYPTEKNIDMVEAIINASSAPGDLVMDCFCGSGTTLVAARNLGRRWIGIDESKRAVDVAKKRLGKTRHHAKKDGWGFFVQDTGKILKTGTGG
ncbi:MAG: site-specific DNA-methyltransferase [Gammaproteobacteria bacterium]|nr:site-specific DNA-methyltransferase [Gammaproteobacteria bacterium]